MRLDHLQDKSSGERGVKGIAATLEHTEPDRAGNPMGRGHRPKHSSDVGSGGECHDGS